MTIMIAWLFTRNFVFPPTSIYCICYTLCMQHNCKWESVWGISSLIQVIFWESPMPTPANHISVLAIMDAIIWRTELMKYAAVCKLRDCQFITLQRICSYNYSNYSTNYSLEYIVITVSKQSYTKNLKL